MYRDFTVTQKRILISLQDKGENDCCEDKVDDRELWQYYAFSYLCICEIEDKVEFTVILFVCESYKGMVY